MSTTITHEQFVIDGGYQTAVLPLEIVAAAVPEIGRASCRERV